MAALGEVYRVWSKSLHTYEFIVHAIDVSTRKVGVLVALVRVRKHVPINEQNGATNPGRKYRAGYISITHN